VWGAPGPLRPCVVLSLLFGRSCATGQGAPTLTDGAYKDGDPLSASARILGLVADLRSWRDERRREFLTVMARRAARPGRV
jgi:hypothetical protein